MYGTIARLRVRQDALEDFLKVAQDIESARIPGQAGILVYQMDKDKREFYMAVAFESREAYFANANSPEQHERFLQLMSVLEAEPEWHDGEIVYSMM
jgi:quinol monooxygenase YgiN